MRKKTVYIIIGSVLALGAVFCLVKLAAMLYAPQASLTATINSEEETTGLTVAADASAAAYVCPIDFEKLQSYNSDIYAWVYVENTNINYPVVQSPDDDSYYLTHNSDGEYSSAGSIFTEHEFNSKDFNDPVTVLYGHHMKSGVMFGYLQSYFTNDEFWDAEPVIAVYLPDRALVYTVFAAVPYESDHMLFNRDFNDEEVFTDFFDDILATTSNEARFHEEYAPEKGDKVIALSTCLNGNSNKRFVVFGKLVYDSSAQ